MTPDIFQNKILQWFDVNGRNNLPWQQDSSPYKTWLSEVMLQQTQVVTVIPYFNKFIDHFSDINQLADAPIDQVLQLWSGLGYYARARNLHKTAKIISSQDGQFPNDLEALVALPGIGRSTAGAILSIAFNNSHPILDGNVKRVLARFHAVVGWPGTSAVNNRLWGISALYTPNKRCADYTQAMMDLGATLCTRSKPRCEICPINLHCLAKSENKVSELPTRRPKKELPVKQLFFLILQDEQGQILLQKRPDIGIWGGLWSLLEFESLALIDDWCLQNNFVSKSTIQFDVKRHTFSHYHLDYTAVLIKTENPINNVMEGNQTVWYKSEQINLVGLPAPIKKLLHNLN